MSNESNTPNDSNLNLEFEKDPPISFRSLRYTSIINALNSLKISNRKKIKKTLRIEQTQVKFYKEASRKFINSPFMLLLEVILVVVYTLIISFEMTVDEETHQDDFVAFRLTESLILAVLWFILTMRIIKNFRNHSSKSHKKRKKPWIFLDIIVTVLISFPSSSIPFIASGLKIDYLWLKNRLKFLYVFQSLAILKLFFFIKPMRKLIVKIFVEPFYKLYLLALILLTITVYTIFTIYFFKAYIESDNPNLKYQYRFKSFSSAWTTVLQIMTFDEWSEIYNDIILVENKYKVYIFILSWIWIGGFIFAHLFVGIYVDNFIDLKGRRQKQQKKIEKKLQEYRKLLQESMDLQRNANNEKNNEANTKPNQDKRKKNDNFTTEFEDVKQIGLRLKSQSMQLKKIIKEFDKSRVIFKRKGLFQTIKKLDSSLSFYGVNDTLMWDLDKEPTKEYLMTLYQISQNLAERSQLRDLLTLVLHEITNNSDQLE